MQNTFSHARRYARARPRAQTYGRGQIDFDMERNKSRMKERTNKALAASGQKKLSPMFFLLFLFFLYFS